ncbi:MAG: DUF502 domain-containing protein [Spirochaetales bacterium]|nr:DUF502 domain-containing protein [Spirochaetales bacterium]
MAGNKIKKQGLFGRIGAHFKRVIMRGILALIPLIAVVLVLSFLYNIIDKKITHFIFGYLHFTFPGMGILILLVFLYIIGLLAKLVFNSWFYKVFDRVALKLPIIGTSYKIGKQISSTMLMPDRDVFKRVVLVHFYGKDTLVIGFVTGNVSRKRNGRKLLKIFIPTSPNPTSGYLLFLDEKDVIDPGWTIEEGINTIISGGVIGVNEVDL